MLHKRLNRAHAFSWVALLILVGCDPTGTGTVSRAGSFQSQYEAARGALEAGKYQKALRRYSALIERADPAAAARLRLEYAHTLLRADRFSDASLMARQSAAEQTGLARASALSVQATADHEIARAAIARGQYDRAVYDRLVSAQTAFDEVLASNPELDAGGGLTSRRRDVARAEAAVKVKLGI